jgi:putative CocE/NonD family hydrolase
MRVRGAGLVLLCLSAANLLADEPYGISVSRGVMVPMRDGARLATNVYRPARNGVAAEGRFPVVLERTPYNKDNSDGWAEAFVPYGYVFVSQDVRGRYASEGRWRPHRDDGRDGYDTAAWIGVQPWCDGGIGTVGVSYPGGTQHALAIANPPFLKAMIPVDAMSDYGRYGIRHHGAFELRFYNWILNFGFAPSPVRQPGIDAQAGTVLGDLREQVLAYVKSLPLRRGTTPLALAPDYEDWIVGAMSHGGNDSFWKDMGASVVDHLAEYKDVPVCHVGGWYDSWAGTTANLNYVELALAKKSRQRLIMGPWTHGGQRRSYAGEAEFGPEAAIDFAAFQRRWFDRWLKGIDNGVDREPPVRLFVMGGGDAHKTAEGRVFVGGHWRDEQEWPLARTQSIPYYVHADGTLSTAGPSASAPTRFTFDPRHPVPTIGGNLSSENTPTPHGSEFRLMFRGAADQRCRPDFWLCADALPLASRNDVLVYRTPPLEADTEVTGRLVVKLWASSSALDTDFTAKLVDVYPPSPDFPAGLALNVGDSIVRARFRDSLDKETLLTPGQVYAFTIEMYPTSLVFARGHRIRLDLSSSNFPRFDVNPNTGEPLNDNRCLAVATNAIYHDPEHPTQIVLPVIPPRPADPPPSRP